MIRFSCKNCGSAFERTYSDAGTLVFCACGTANRVPFEVGEAGPRAARPTEERPLPSRRRVPVGPRPGFCFHHPETAAEPRCAGCGEQFCPDCLVNLRGVSLCGPCKELRIRQMQRPSRLSLPALFSLLTGLVAMPTGLFCFVPLVQATRTSVIGFAGLIIPLVAFVLGLAGLRAIERNPRLHGRGLAIGGLVASLAAALLSVAWTIMIGRQVD